MNKNKMNKTYDLKLIFASDIKDLYWCNKILCLLIRVVVWHNYQYILFLSLSKDVKEENLAVVTYC